MARSARSPESLDTEREAASDAATTVDDALERPTPASIILLSPGPQQCSRRYFTGSSWSVPPHESPSTSRRIRPRGPVCARPGPRRGRLPLPRLHARGGGVLEERLGALDDEPGRAPRHGPSLDR